MHWNFNSNSSYMSFIKVTWSYENHFYKYNPQAGVKVGQHFQLISY